MRNLVRLVVHHDGLHQAFEPVESLRAGSTAGYGSRTSSPEAIWEIRRTIRGDSDMVTQPVSYRFGAFRLDPVSYQCFCEDALVPLAPKGLDLLLLLVARPGTLVSKDEIMRALWPDVAVTDNALTQVIADLRHSLGDRSSAPRFIQTVPRRGYRFVAPVVAIPQSRSTEPPMAGGPESARAGVRETASLAAYRAFADGRVKLETMDAVHASSAIADFERAVTLDPRYALPYVGLAHARFWLYEATRARNRPDAAVLTAAIADAHHAIDLDPDLAEAHAALALMLMSAGRPAEAVFAGRRSVALEPGNWRNQCRLGIAAWGNERLAAFDRVLELYPDFAYAYYGLAMVHIARGDLPRAEQSLRRGGPLQDRSGATAERFPGKGLHWLLGLTRLASGDHEEAALEFDRELASTGTEVYAAEFAMNAYDGHGFVKLGVGDTDGARAMFTRALDTFPDHARSLLGLADAFHRVGLTSQRDAAIQHATRAAADLRSNGRVGEAAMASAFCHVVSERPAEAVQTLEQLLVAAPPGFVGWTIPIEPFFTALRPNLSFQAVLRRLADRAS